MMHRRVAEAGSPNGRVCALMVKRRQYCAKVLSPRVLEELYDFTRVNTEFDPSAQREDVQGDATPLQ